MRKILHLDLDAFFCAVEELRDPTLRGKPFAVGGSPTGRGVVASCSYPARAAGVRSAMPMARAIKLCPDLLVVRSDHRRYSMVSRQVMARVRTLTPLVEQISIDEAFLDVSEVPGSAVTLAQGLQQVIRAELGLPCSLGVATNKLVAKIANNVGKANARGDGPPNAIQVVPPGQEARFLAPLPVDELWGVGPKTAVKLRDLGMDTIGAVAAWDEQDLTRRFGKHGADLSRRARGMDTRPVVTEHEAKSISQERTFAHDIDNADELRAILQRLAQGVAVVLRRKQLLGSTVKLKLRWEDFDTPSRQMTLSQPTDNAERLYAAAIQLFDKLWIEEQLRQARSVRLLGVGVSGLQQQTRQYELWEMESEEFLASEATQHKQARLDEVMRLLDEKFGDGIVTRGGEKEDANDA